MTGMRGAIDGAESPAPFITRLPAVLQDDEVMRRFLTGFDHAMAPVFLTLDCLPAYVDPALAPPDFVDWLGGWVGSRVPASSPIDARRRGIGAAVGLQRRRGTIGGLEAALRQIVGEEADIRIDDDGGVVTSSSPGTAFPGRSRQRLVVSITMASSGQVDRALIDATVAETKPAHLPHVVTVTEAAYGTPETAPTSELPDRKGDDA